MDVKYSETPEVRVRFAPSPTGDLHIGGLRTALYNYLFAKANNGKFILRIEDTDKNREVEGSSERLIESLKWAGLKFDEGAGVVIEDASKEKYRQGPYSPYKQSERLDIYKKFVEFLLENGQAYHCFCTTERLKNMRQQQAGMKHHKTKYDRFCHGMDQAEVQRRVKDGEPYVIRMFVPKGKTEFEDLVHGKVVFDNDTVDDQVIMKSDGYPTYHLANVVDDFMMKITHVIRGEEWLPSTPKHIILYKMFEMDLPTFAHLPLLMSMGGQKLSKRHGDVSVQDFRSKGYLPEALVNGIALLGWNPPQYEDPNVLSATHINTFLKSEVMQISEMEKVFNIHKIGKSAVKFEEKKLEYLNQQHIRYKYTYLEDVDEKDEAVTAWRQVMLDQMPSNLEKLIRKMPDSKIVKIMDMMKIRIHFYSDLENHTYFFEDPDLMSERSVKFASKLKQPNHV